MRLSAKINFVIDDFFYRGDKEVRIVVIKIPAAVNEPTYYMSKPWIRVDSHTTELTPYTEWIRSIYNSRIDWTAQIIEGATMDDLDENAIQLAREGYRQRFPDYEEEMQTWSNDVFLDKVGLTQDGQITRAAMLLVGKQEKAYKLPHSLTSWMTNRKK